MKKTAQLRPFYLARILYERTDENHALTTQKLQMILEEEYNIKTHRQTVPSDVQLLRELGMDIKEVMSDQKYYNLVSRKYDIAELKLLIDAVASSKFITKKKCDKLVEKLSEMASIYQTEELKRNIAVEGRVKRDNESILVIIDSINEAINTGKKISFLYFKYDIRKRQKLSNGGEPFVFSPHHLIWNGDYYYMVGMFDNGKRHGTFRLDRIAKRPEILNDKALPFPQSFKLSKYLQTSFRMYGKTYTTVELICSNDVVDAIIDRFGKNISIYPCDENHFKITADASVNNAFFSWIFGFGGDVVINEPSDVKKQYKEMVQKVAESL